MKKLALSMLTLFVIQVLTFGQQESNFITQLENPKTSFTDNIITHTGYSLLYNEACEQASWVAYELTKLETDKLFERINKFIIDPKVKTGTANNKDYSRSGYDRGHLAPASDMGWSATTMTESFYYSNMSPQTPVFNRGIWKRLEELVRTWAIENKIVYIVTGPVLTIGLQTIGANKVSVPDYFYKVILDYTEPGLKGIGFIISNNGSKEPLQDFAVSIDDVEKITGIDFFPKLPDDQEEIIEKNLCTTCWSWQSFRATNNNSKVKTSASVQCPGTTKSGNRCKRKTKSLNGRCHDH